MFRALAGVLGQELGLSLGEGLAVTGMCDLGLLFDVRPLLPVCPAVLERPLLERRENSQGMRFLAPSLRQVMVRMPPRSSGVGPWAPGEWAVPVGRVGRRARRGGDRPRPELAGLLTLALTLGARVWAPRAPAPTGISEARWRLWRPCPWGLWSWGLRLDGEGS